MAKPTLLVISQGYVPDPASVGQHMADAAEALVARGYRVVVLTSARGYENPSIKYPRRERRDGVEILRLRFSSFGKKSLSHRLLGQLLYLLQVIARGIFTRRLSGIVVSTSPPMAAFAAIAIGWVRRAPVTYWLMDLNPDQIVEMGQAKTWAWMVSTMKWLNRRVFARAAAVVVLDRYMAERVKRQYHVGGRLTVLPPWPHESALDLVPHGANPFRCKFNPQGRFVVMYSGNHSLASPVTTLLRTAITMRDDPRFLFMFIGGGLGKREVEEAIASQKLPNIVALPYQPLETIKFSLSAADLHVITLGNNMPGIIHPCKIYGAMAVGRPVLVIGPRPSHASELIDRHKMGWQIAQGDIEAAIDTLQKISTLSPDELGEIGQRGRTAVRNEYSKGRLCEALCDVVDMTVRYSRTEAALAAEAPQSGVAQ